MEKKTLKEIRSYIALGIAEDITRKSFEEIEALRTSADLQKIAYSVGVYGISGALLQDRTSGKMYAITSRSTSLFQLI